MRIQVSTLFNPHSHMREGEEVVEDLLLHAGNAGMTTILPMPNTKDGLQTADQVVQYIGMLKRLSPVGKQLKFIPTVMITPDTTLAMLDECIKQGIWDAKIYPLGRTTHSEQGVRWYHRLLPVIAHCAKLGIRVHVHPEYPNLEYSGRDAEYLFLPIVEMFLDTGAIIIWEHGSDARCIPHWKTMARTGRFYVTLTAHHLATNEDLMYGDVSATCKPPLKTLYDQLALIVFVCEGYTWVIAALDDAPHDKKKKHPTFGGCACGAYTAPFGIQLYAHALGNFLRLGQANVEIFNRFIRGNAEILYGLSGDLDVSDQTMLTLEDVPFKIRTTYRADAWEIIPFMAGKELSWSIAA